MIEFLFYILGIYYIGFAVFHCFFWKIFNWRNDLRKISRANAAILQIANIQLIFYFIGMGLVFFYFNKVLPKSEVGYFTICFGLGFWLVRFLNQFIFLRMKSKIVHSLSLIFFIGIVLHILVLL
ncbi:hypothetical protein [Leptospira sp. GIMC2001]|uniref:hypothetical protein n=1 Tax=Leptospira sp. GIMC2001 TaxID=1513297 RepID=UPI00234BED8D|nr:hypothetical protein [Leptospira sp. GIMC2001]WCL50538.1 hypothetical protein O4O04_06880 [Leptospira sp. GIMC2001]